MEQRYLIIKLLWGIYIALTEYYILLWHHIDRDGVSNHRCLDFLFNRLFRRRSKKKSKLRVTGLCEGNSPMTGQFPTQRASDAENVSIWWRHHSIAAFALFSSCPSKTCKGTSSDKMPYFGTPTTAANGVVFIHPSVAFTDSSAEYTEIGDIMESSLHGSHDHHSSHPQDRLPPLPPPRTLPLPTRANIEGSLHPPHQHPLPPPVDLYLTAPQELPLTRSRILPVNSWYDNDIIVHFLFIDSSYLGTDSANETRRYIYNDLSHWLRSFSRENLNSNLFIVFCCRHPLKSRSKSNRSEEKIPCETII